MCPWLKVETLAERYDLARYYMREDHLPPGAPRPEPSSHWPPENIELLERYRNWLLDGGTSELVTNLYHIMMAGHVFGLTLKPYQQLDLDHDLECALEYVKAKQLSAGWTKNCRNSLIKFRRFLRIERGLGEETKARPFDVTAYTAGLPAWLVSEMERYQHVQQRNWRMARLEAKIRNFWARHLNLWRFLCQERGVHELADVKRQFVLDYVDRRLDSGHAVSGVNGDLHSFHSFLLFLQDEGYSVPQSLLRIPSLKEPDPLPKYLTDEQVILLRDDFERGVAQAKLSNHLRAALMDRAMFYLLWQGGLRLGEAEELRLEDLDIPARKLTVRNGKGLKDRAIYLTGTVIAALSEYLAVRGEGSSDHVFLYHNAPLGLSMLYNRMKAAGKRVGMKVYPHRLRHTCGTQLLNAGCRITSIQRFLGHKRLNTTMIYARAYDQTVADDYFAAMQRVEQRLDTSAPRCAVIPPAPEPSLPPCELVAEPEHIQLLGLIEQLAQPELCFPERLEIVAQLRQALGWMAVPSQDSIGSVAECFAVQVSEHPPQLIISR